MQTHLVKSKTCIREDDEEKQGLLNKLDPVNDKVDMKSNTGMVHGSQSNGRNSRSSGRHSDGRKSLSFLKNDLARMDNELLGGEVLRSADEILAQVEEQRRSFDYFFQAQLSEQELYMRNASQSLNLKDRNQLQASQVAKRGAEGKGGKFVRIEGAKFDIILNILIGIRRSLQTLVHLPGVELSDWQFRKSMMSESDWIDQGMQ